MKRDNDKRALIARKGTRQLQTPALEPSHLLRPLGTFEELFCLFDQHFPPTMHLQPKSPATTVQRWRDALDAVQQRHPLLSACIDTTFYCIPHFHFTDFSFFRLQPIDLYYVGGFGVMGWVEAGEYEHAAPDPLAEAAPGILAHMNADHVDSMILLARSYAQIEAVEATMTSVDRLGFSLRLKTPEGIKGARINFLHEVATAQETRKMLIEMVEQSRR